MFLKLGEGPVSFVVVVELSVRFSVSIEDPIFRFFDNFGVCFEASFGLVLR